MYFCLYIGNFICDKMWSRVTCMCYWAEDKMIIHVLSLHDNNFFLQMISEMYVSALLEIR